ncbi:MAG: filamentous hemagglutinin N-terminal domain-containing protein, partial [Gammaproteobacteria bacterium TMED134]
MKHHHHHACLSGLRFPEPWRRQLISGLLSGSLIFQPVLVNAASNIVVDDTQTTTSQASNGVTVVDIATANSRGLSHNRYEHFNVDAQGAILNNSAVTISTNLAGLISGNGSLVPGAEASLILNEVTAANRSQLDGALEVAGSAADVVLANPYGITCNGCGFINTPRLTLSTGAPMLSDTGDLSHFSVIGGDIAITGEGMNALEVQRLDILARAIQLNAQLHAQQAFLVSGRNTVAADFSNSAGITPLEPTAASEADKPLFAIDSSALGGMYTNRILLIGTEAGVGFRLGGDLYASAGNILIQADGSIAAASIDGAVDIDLRSNGGGIGVDDSLRADGDIVLTANTDVRVNGNMTAGERVLVQARSLTNAAESLIQSGVARDGSVISGHNMTVSLTDNLINNGHIKSAGALDLSAQHMGQGGIVSSVGASEYSLNTLTNTGELVSGGDLQLLIRDTLDNTAGTLRHLGTGPLALDTSNLINVSGHILGEGAATLTVNETDNTLGLIRTKTLSVTGNNWSNLGGMVEGQ